MPRPRPFFVSGARDFLTIGIVLTVQMLVALASVAVPVLAPVIAGDLRMPLNGLGLFVALVYAFAAVSGLLAGWLVDRYGAFTVCALCLAATCTAMAIAATGPGAALAVVAILVGCAYGPMNVASSDLLFRIAPPGRLNTLFSLKQTSVPAGNALAGALLPWLSLLAGWRGALAGVALCAGSTALLLYTLSRGRDGDGTTTRSAEPIAALRRVAAHWPLRQRILAAASFSALQICFTSFLVSYLVGNPHLSLVDAGLVLSVALVAGVAGRIVWGLVADSRVAPGTLLGSLGLAMALMATLPVLLGRDWPLPALLAAGAACGFVVTGWNGVYFAEICRLAPRDGVNHATAAASFVTFGSAVVAPAIFSVILSATDSYALGYLVFAGAAAVSALSFFGSSHRA